MSTIFPLNAKVRFTQERLAVLTPRDRQGLAGRIGVVQTDGHVVSKPTVYFPADGHRPKLRLFRVDPRQLELVVGTPGSEETDVPHRVDEPSLAPGPVAGGAGNLSQSDLDNFFG